MTGCGMKIKSPEITEIVYSVESGPILPELQMIEEYTITRDGVRLARSGKYEYTKVFEGEWVFTADQVLLSDLFTIAEKKNCSDFQRMEPEVSPDGGQTITVKLVYTDGNQCELRYDPGVIYKGAEEILNALQQIVQNLGVAPGAQIE